jgi:hypothetical protein
MANKSKGRRRAVRSIAPTFHPFHGVHANASVRFDVNALTNWKPEQVQALFAGIGKVLSAAQSATEPPCKA